MIRIILILLLTHCLISPAWAAAAQWTDALGRVVQVDEQPQRIVSLVPSVTEILFALGLGDRVVGVTEFCTYPSAALSKARAGGYGSPNLEAVVGLRPDLVLTSADATSPAFVSRLESLGIPTYVVYPRSLADTSAMIKNIGRVTGALEQAEKQAQCLDQTVAAVRDAVAGLSRPRTLVSVMLQPLIVAGPETLANDLLQTVGAENIVPQSPGRYPTWNPEAVLAADPDVFLVSQHSVEVNPGELFAGWSALKAVRENRVVSIDPDLILRPGPRLALGLAAMARAVHGLEVQIQETSCPE